MNQLFAWIVIPENGHVEKFIPPRMKAQGWKIPRLARNDKPHVFCHFEPGEGSGTFVFFVLSWQRQIAG
jgi:hypothetical protein